MYKDGGKSRLYPTSYLINRAQRDTLHKIRYGKYRSFVYIHVKNIKTNPKEGKQQLCFNVSSRKLHVVLVVLAYN